MKKKPDYNQQKHGKMTHFVLKISFCILTLDRFVKIIQIHQTKDILVEWVL